MDIRIFYRFRNKFELTPMIDRRVDQLLRHDEIKGEDFRALYTN